MRVRKRLKMSEVWMRLKEWLKMSLFILMCLILYKLVQFKT